MNIITEPTKNTAVAIGNFDGVHLGHQYLLKKMRIYAEKKALIPTVLTFIPHPKTFYGKQAQLISSKEQKEKIFYTLGIENILYVNFNKTFAAMTPEEFLEQYLIKILDAKAIFVGVDFHFGFNKSGSAETLKKLSEKNDVYCEIVDKLRLNDTQVSSSLTRSFINDGKIENAKLFLGRDFSITGRVVKGNQLGSKIGFPTANIEIYGSVYPKQGVYAGYTYINAEKYPAMIYYGDKPTINGKGKSFEAHIIGVDRNLYDEFLEIFLVSYIGESEKFDNLDQLKKQLELYKKITMSIFNA